MENQTNETLESVSELRLHELYVESQVNRDAKLLTEVIKELLRRESEK